MTTRTERIRTLLEAAFQPSHLEVIDESEAHRGHTGWRDGGETHFRVEMRAAAFSGLSRIARSRAVHKALAAELTEDGIHALALTLSAEEGA
ncbi:MAG: BolA family protein [Pseudomonadota bacterium]